MNENNGFGFAGDSIVKPAELPAWNSDHSALTLNDTSYTSLLQRTRGITLEDIHIHPHHFRPKILRISKREAIRKRV